MHLKAFVGNFLTNVYIIYNKLYTINNHYFTYSYDEGPGIVIKKS